MLMENEICIKEIFNTLVHIWYFLVKTLRNMTIECGLNTVKIKKPLLWLTAYQKEN